MIHAVLQWQVKKKPTPVLSTTGAPPEETSTEPGAEIGSPGRAGTESGALPDKIGIDSEALPSEAGAKTSATTADQVLPSHDADDAGEGPSSLIREKPVPKQDENKEEKLDEEHSGELKQELNSKIATSEAHPKRPLLGLVLTPTRELAVQVKQHIDAVAKFTGEV